MSDAGEGIAVDMAPDGEDKDALKAIGRAQRAPGRAQRAQ
jgi:hypothetical protein